MRNCGGQFSVSFLDFYSKLLDFFWTFFILFLDFSTGSTEILKTYLVILQCLTLIGPDFSGLLTIVSVF